MKKIELENKLYSAVTCDEYLNNKDLYNPKSTAIICGDVVLPIRTPCDKAPGIYYSNNGNTMVSNVIKPKNPADYSVDKIIDFDNANNISEVIKNNEMLRDLQSDLMVSGKDGNIFYLNISPEDTPEMAALKTAINSKQVDKKAYEQRFTQFQNDMRLLKGNSITLSKMIGICNGFDISCILTLRNRRGAANPMTDEIVVDLTEDRPSKNNVEMVYGDDCE